METINLYRDASARRAIPSGATVTMVPAADSWPLRVFDWPAPGEARGTLMFQGGRGDIFEKYLEAFAHWHARGWRVTSFDWRGQGGSGRMSDDPMVGHIDAFEPWIDDLAERFALSTGPGPRVVVAHSMGGHLVLRALIEQRIAPAAAVFVAPMLGLKSAPLSQKLALRVARLMPRLGKPRRAAWKTNERPALPNASRRAFLTHCAERYSDELWWKEQNAELRIGPPSWEWLALAYASTLASFAPGVLERVATPILLLAADHDKLVQPRAIHAAAARLPNAELIRFGNESAHEILREVDDVRLRALAEIDRFLDARAPRT